MFGKTIDYWLLRPLVHGRNRATEEELDARAGIIKPFNSAAARQRLEKLIVRFEGTFWIDPDLDYLDVGCGHGDLALAMIQAGATSVTGIDVVERHIQAANAASEQVGGTNRPHFVCADIKTWYPDRRYDVIISNESLEHINHPAQFINSLPRLLKPGGLCFLAFGPMFHSPVGDHLEEFFRITLPWRGVLFSERALLRLRQEFFRPGDPVERFQDMVAGLNLMRFSEFLKYVEDAGLDLGFMRINPQLKSIPPMYWISEIIARTPLARDYFVVSVYAMLERPESAEQRIAI